MCMAFYVASDVEIALLPWDDEMPGLFVQALQSDVDAVIAQHFSKPRTLTNRN